MAVFCAAAALAALCQGAASAPAPAGVDWCAFTTKLVNEAPNDFIRYRGAPVQNSAGDFVGLATPAPDIVCHAHSIFMGDDPTDKHPHGAYSCYLFSGGVGDGDKNNWCVSDSCRHGSYADTAAQYENLKKRLKACFPVAKFEEKRSGSRSERDSDWELNATLPRSQLLVRFYNNGKDDDEMMTTLGGTPKHMDEMTMWLTVWNRAQKGPPRKESPTSPIQSRR